MNRTSSAGVLDNVAALCYADSMSTNKRLFFQGGTLVLDGGTAGEAMPAPFAWINSRWRCPAYAYGTLLPWLAQQGITNQVPRWQPLHVPLLDEREPHDYQHAALAAWNEAQRRGSGVLPTGAGKTLVAIHAIAQVNRSAVVVCRYRMEFTSSELSGTGVLPPPTNPVTRGVFFTACHISSSISS